MIKRIQTTLLALLAILGSVSAQTLSVQPIEVQTGEQTEVVVSLTGGTSATALQFNLKLPEGVSVNANGATLGSATNGHTLSVETLDSGDLLIILYSMDLKTFKDGELLRIPVTVGNSTTNATGQLYTVRTATVSGEDAVSHTCTDVPFDVITYMLGDVNGDGNVTPSDAIMILYDYFEVEQQNFHAIAADVNHDDNISPADAIEVLYMYFNADQDKAPQKPQQIQQTLEPQ